MASAALRRTLILRQVRVVGSGWVAWPSWWHWRRSGVLVRPQTGRRVRRRRRRPGPTPGCTTIRRRGGVVRGWPARSDRLRHDRLQSRPCPAGRVPVLDGAGAGQTARRGPSSPHVPRRPRTRPLLGVLIGPESGTIDPTVRSGRGFHADCWSRLTQEKQHVVVVAGVRQARWGRESGTRGACTSLAGAR